MEQRCARLEYVVSSGSLSVSSRFAAGRRVSSAAEKITRSQRHQGFLNLGLWATFTFKMTVTIPSELLANITLNERDAIVDIAIGLYKREQVSLGRAAEISGLSSPEFLNELGRRRIPINYEAEDLRLDLETLKSLS